MKFFEFRHQPDSVVISRIRTPLSGWWAISEKILRGWGRVFWDAHFKVVNASLLDSQNEAELGENQNSGST
jgi:hypothetical protein